MADFKFDQAGKTLSWKYYTVTNDGQVHVFFEDHRHETLNLDDLDSTVEAGLTNAAGAAVKAAAEKIEKGSSAGITQKNIRDELQAKNNDRMAAKETEPEAEPAQK